MDEDNRNFVEKIIKNLFIGINKVVHSYSPEEVLKSAKNRVNVILCKIKKGKPLNAEEVADKLKKDKELRFYATYGDMNYFLDCLSEPLNDYFNPENGIEITDEDLDDTKRVIASLKEKWLKEAYKNETKNKKINLFLIKKHDDHDVQKLTENFAYSARGQFTVFLSAITNKKGSSDKTLEYEVAKKLKDKLKDKGCNVFWWEDDIPYDNENMNDLWNISTKISMGLAFSSLFIGLAFDSVTRQENGKYVYNCMFTEGDNAYKTPNYFKYEVEKFDALRSNKNKIEKFVKPLIHKQKDFDKYVPYGKDKVLKFYTLGNPESFDNEYKIFNNKGYLNSKVNEEICKIYYGKDTENKKAEDIANIIFKNLPAVYLDNLINKQKEIDKETFDLLAEIKEPECFKPFAGDGAYLSEDSTSVPSNYLFKYAILDSKGNSAKDRFTIFPEKKMGNYGWEWSIKLVDKKYNYAMAGVGKPYSDETGKVDSVKTNKSGSVNTIIFDGPKGETTTLKDDSTRVDSNGVILLRNGNDMSLGYNSGTITLTDEKYTFDILFYPKLVLHYRYNKKLKTFVIRDLKDVDKNNFNLSIYASGVKKPNSFISRPHKVNISKFISNSMNSDDKDYVLNPWGKTANYYVMLKDRKTKVDKPIQNRKKRCPYCGRFIGHGKDECPPGKTCKWNFIYNNTIDDKGNFNNSDKDYKDKLKSNNLKAKEGRSIPRKEFDKSGVISFIGSSQSGKSTFISSLFGARGSDETESEGQVKDPDCRYIKDVLRAYANIEYCYTNKPKDSKENFSTTFLSEHYSPILYQNIVSGTPNTEQTKELICHVPYTLELRNIQGKKNSNAFLSFFDAPGGYICDDDKFPKCPFLGEILGEKRNNNDEDFILDATMAFRSDCLIVFINRNNENKKEDKSTSNNNQGNNSTAFTSACHIMNKLKEKYDAEHFDSKKVALAMVFCKFDVFAAKFNKNSYLRTTPPAIKGKHSIFEDSPTQDYINNCSCELVEYLEDPEVGGKNLVEAVKKFTPNYKFFAVSSTGRSDTVKDNQELYFTEPSNIENVLLWIMFKIGIIR